MAEAEIARRYGVTQQAVSKALLKYIRDVPAAEARELRREQMQRLAAMRKALMEASYSAKDPRIMLRCYDVLIRCWEREAKVLGLDADCRRANGRRERRGLDRSGPARWGLASPASSLPIQQRMLRDLERANRMTEGN